MPRRAKRPLADHAACAAVMREHPGEWSQVGVYNSQQSARGMARMIRTGEGKAYRPAGSFESSIRMVEDGYAVDARYVGGGS